MELIKQHVTVKPDTILQLIVNQLMNAIQLHVKMVGYVIMVQINGHALAVVHGLALIVQPELTDAQPTMAVA